MDYLAEYKKISELSKFLKKEFIDNGETLNFKRLKKKLLSMDRKLKEIAAGEGRWTGGGGNYNPKYKL